MLPRGWPLSLARARSGRRREDVNETERVCQECSVSRRNRVVSCPPRAVHANDPITAAVAALLTNSLRFIYVLPAPSGTRPRQRQRPSAGQHNPVLVAVLLLPGRLAGAII